MKAFAVFLKKHDVEGTVEDFAKAIEGRFEAEGEINDDAVETVAGGYYKDPWPRIKDWKAKEIVLRMQNPESWSGYEN